MRRITITMTADVADLPAFYGDAGQQNVYDLIALIKLTTLMRLLENASSDLDPMLKVACEKALQADLQLAERLLHSLRIDVLNNGDAP